MLARNLIKSILITSFFLRVAIPVLAVASVEEEFAWTDAMSNASLQIAQNNQAEAERYYNQGLDEARKLGKNTAEEIITLRDLSSLFARSKRLAQCQEVCQAAVEAASNTNDPDHLNMLIDALERLNRIIIKRKGSPAPDIAARIATLKAEKDKTDNNVNFSNYLARLQMIMRKAWTPHKGRNQLRDVQCDWRILKDGSISLLSVSSSSGDEMMDHSVLVALRKASPLEAPPEAASDAVAISFTFDYNSAKDFLRDRPSSFKRDQSDAVVLLEKDLKATTEKVGPNDPSLISLLVSLANALEGADQFNEMEKRAKEALANYESNHLSDPMTKALILDMVCRSLINQDKYNELDRVMQEALSSRSSR